MFTITKLKMWKDPGYTRQCVEVPPVGSKKLPTPDYVSSGDLRPRRGSTLSEIELPLSYLEVFDMSYLYIEAKDGKDTPNTVSIFGWILSIEEIASASEAVRITWTPDYWRTYAGSATFGKGTITRCNNATYKRPYKTPPRRWKVDKAVDFVPLASTEKLGFIIMTSEKQTIAGEEVITGFNYYWSVLDYVYSGYTPYRTLKTSEMYSGKIDEILGIIPSEIIGAWIVPSIICNSRWFSGTTTESTTYEGETIQFYKSTGIIGTNHGEIYSSMASVKADDEHRIVMIDPYGRITSELPWGYGFNAMGSADIIPDISAEGVTIYIRLAGNDIGGTFSERYALTVGCFLVTSGIPIPLNTNAWSEYAYTYQRQYDKEMREIQRNQKAVSSLTNVGVSTAGGALTGATVGAMGGPIGAVGGAVAGAVAGVAGPVIDYFTTGYFNDKLQEETDKLISNQTSNVLISGGGPGWRAMAENWRFVVLKADVTSETEYTQNIALNGYTVEIPVNNPNSFLSTGGPLQIQNLMLTGPIPPEAKTYIKNILSNGVRIVENNPTGVNP